MSIVKMKRLRAVIPKTYRREVIKDMYTLGCVEVETMSQSTDFLDIDVPVIKRSENSGAGRALEEIKKAKSAISGYIPEEKSMFRAKPAFTELALYNEKTLDQAVQVANEINTKIQKKDELNVADIANAGKLMTLAPWESLEMPVEYAGSTSTAYFLGTLPSVCVLAQLREHIEKEIGGSEIIEVSTDAQLHYISVLSHKSCLDSTIEYLRHEGFSPVAFTDFKGTVRSQIENLKQKRTETVQKKKETEQDIKNMGNVHALLEQAYDAYFSENERDELLSEIAYTGKAAIITGWMPEKAESAVSDIFDKYSCAYRYDDPAEGENPPTVLESGKASEPLNAITEMYGMPRYDSIIDPNPLILPFYVTFFGVIMADMAYGLILFFGCIAAMKILKPQKGNMHNILRLFTYCGVSTFIFGILTGSFLGDFIPLFSQAVSGTAIPLKPLWFSPLDQPMTMLVFSIALGLVQILVGMGVSAARMIKRGDWIGAVCDIGSWYLVFLGLGLFGLSFMGIDTWYWYYVSLAGVALMLVTGGRNSPTIIGKLTGGLGSLYSVTGYVSDLLSYSRLMALGLSGAVVGSVVNKMGAMGGDSILGIALFVAVAIIGHTFNLAISVLGAYVHTSRLQYIEYFGRFYEDGGRIMKPLRTKTKYTRIEN